jgi:hypothetical protein
MAEICGMCCRVRTARHIACLRSRSHGPEPGPEIGYRCVAFGCPGSLIGSAMRVGGCTDAPFASDVNLFCDLDGVIDRSVELA